MGGCLGAEKPFIPSMADIRQDPAGIQTDNKIRVAGKGYRDKSGIGETCFSESQW
jgi:hypothetical protein